MRSALVPLLLLAACRAIRVDHVETTFAADHARLALRVPDGADMNPARAANPKAAMQRTEQVARRYLDEHPGDDGRNASYVRALLACALLAQGRTADARDTVEPVTGRLDRSLGHDSAVTMATVALVSACRAIDARRALAEMVAGRLPVRDFVLRYGSLAGFQVPDPSSPDYERLLDVAIQRVRGRCLPYTDDPIERERARRGQADVRRLVGEQLYNEAAAMMTRLPPPGGPPRTAPIDRWLASCCTGLWIVHGKIMPDLLPTPLSERQKQWLLDQVLPLYVRAKALGAHFLTREQRDAIAPEAGARRVTGHEAYYRHLYALLLDAEIAASGWIGTR